MKDWKKASVSPLATIKQTIECLESSGKQGVLVVDETNRLLGFVSDGDIRRGILKGIFLDRPVTEIMNSAPITVSDEESPGAILRMMKQREIFQVPVLDAERRVVRVEVLKDLLKGQATNQSTVFLLAGGMGSRLMPLTSERPKPLLKVGEKPILEHIIEDFALQGFQDFVIAVNYKAEMILDYFGDGAKWGTRIRYVQESQALGTAGSLSLLAERPDHPLIVMNGDLLTQVDFRQLLEFHAKEKARATMCVRPYELQVPFGVVQTEGHNLIGLEEKPVQQFLVNAGIYVLNPDVLDEIPANTFFNITTVFDRLRSQKARTVVFPLREYWIDIGRIEDYRRANEEIDWIRKGGSRA